MMHLIPMTGAEFEAYLQHLIPDYAAEHVRAGNWPADEAEDRAAAQVRQLLPEGVTTPDHYLYTLRVDEIDQPVGLIWFGVQHDGIRPRGFVYDIIVYEGFRRRGFGAQAMRAVENKARNLGLDNMTLHVFGHNHAARALYEQLGYTVTDLWMAKGLSS
jgi:ribosomal protein S18 acetylase RimI-like enzyme